MLCTLPNFLLFSDFDIFRASFERLLSVINLFKQHPSYMKSQSFLKVSKKWGNEGVRRM